MSGAVTGLSYGIAEHRRAHADWSECSDTRTCPTLPLSYRGASAWAIYTSLRCDRGTRSPASARGVLALLDGERLDELERGVLDQRHRIAIETLRKVRAVSDRIIPNSGSAQGRRG
jgi:hypothetical protein